MYKIRSKFIHGKLNSTILIEDVFEEEKIMDRYNFPIADAAKLATTLLLSDYSISYLTAGMILNLIEKFSWKGK